jgi:hypothetical protein
MRLVGHIALIGEYSYAYTVSVGNSEGKRPLGWRRRTWENNIQIDLIRVKIWWSDMGCIHLDADFCEHSNEISGSIKWWKILEYLSDCWLFTLLSCGSVRRWATGILRNCYNRHCCTTLTIDARELLHGVVTSVTPPLILAGRGVARPSIRLYGGGGAVLDNGC